MGVKGEYLALRTAPIRRDLSQLQEPIGEAIGLALDRGIERLDRMLIGSLEAAGPVVGERVLDLCLRVHDEGTSKRDRLVQRPAGEKQQEDG